MPPRSKHAKAAGGHRQAGRSGARSFWSGTISFGLVSVPVHLFPASRPGGVALRMLDDDGTPLSRRYYCPEENRDVHPEHLVRGYELDNGDYVIVRDDELEGLAPKKSREIDLRSFVNLSEVPRKFFERAYFLVPAGDSTKAYRLLAEVMEHTQRAGIATFVMRDKEYLVAILSEEGLLRAQTLRFADEIRDAEEVGIPKPGKIPRQQAARFERMIRQHEKDEVDLDALRDTYAAAVRGLVERKRRSGEDLVENTEAPTDEGDAGEESGVDLLQQIRRSLRASGTGSGNGRSRRSDGRSRSANDRGRPSSNKDRAPREEPSKEALYERAKDLNIPGRSRMTKGELARAIRKR